VLSQTPSASDVITYPISKVILYTERTVSESVTVPTLTGLSLSDAVKCAINSGLNIRLLGIGASAASGGDLIAEQSLSPGSVVKRGTVIAIRAINGKYED
jgi:beta-lactam-binding protein with PASTA domain